MDGNVVYYKLFDLEGLIDLKTMDKDSKAAPQPFWRAGRFAMPDYIRAPPFYVVTLDPRPLTTATRTLQVVPTVKIFSIGALSISLSVAFQDCSLETFHTYYNPERPAAGRPSSLDALFTTIYDEFKPKIEPYLQDRYDAHIHPEPYTVFCVTNANGLTALELMDTHRETLATVLTHREPTVKLSKNEVDEILSRWFSYETRDLIVIDWDAAFVLSPSGLVDDLLLVLEISNLMLLELRAYDAYLNNMLDRAYHHIDLFQMKKLKFKVAKATLREIINARIDVLDMSDELTNTTKFIGEWFLAKVYRACSEKFHLQDWEASVNRKLATMSEMYVVLHNALETRKLLVMELAVVYLFVVDIVAFVLTLVIRPI